MSAGIGVRLDACRATVWAIASAATNAPSCCRISLPSRAAFSRKLSSESSCWMAWWMRIGDDRLSSKRPAPGDSEVNGPSRRNDLDIDEVETDNGGEPAAGRGRRSSRRREDAADTRSSSLVGQLLQLAQVRAKLGSETSTADRSARSAR
jgi:hypothetical protein